MVTNADSSRAAASGTASAEFLQGEFQLCCMLVTVFTKEHL